MKDGTLETVEGRPALRFKRHYAHPVKQVWHAVSIPEQLEYWFPAAVQWQPEAGEKIDAHGMHGKVLTVEPPNRLAWEFNADFYSFELTETTQATNLTFLHVFDLAVPTAQTAAGWDVYLAKLDALLAGQPVSDKTAFADWDNLHEYYAAEFGVDPTPGRRFGAQLQDRLGLV